MDLIEYRISYLKDLPEEVMPFDEGLVKNVRIFCRGMSKDTKWFINEHDIATSKGSIHTNRSDCIGDCSERLLEILSQQ
jgi:hypothetical protein